MKTVFVNPERCIGCKQCQIACAVEHSQSKDLYQAVFEPVPPQPRILVAPGQAWVVGNGCKPRKFDIVTQWVPLGKSLREVPPD